MTEPPPEPPTRPAPPWPPPWPTSGEDDDDARSFADAAARAWSEREAIYRLVYHLEARLNALEDVVSDFRTVSSGDRKAIHAQLTRHVTVLRTVQMRLNFVMVMMISVGLFALAGPSGLYDLLAALSGEGELDPTGIATIAGVVIPILYPLGRKIFLSVRPEPPQKDYSHAQDR